MTQNLYPHFLRDAQEYALSEQHWIDLWQQVDPQSRAGFQWQQPWFQALPPALSEGNPIFSAVSFSLRRGIRIIQHEPTEPAIQFQAWMDTFGGNRDNAEHIEELVISCALSHATSRIALSLIQPWVNGEDVSRLLRDLGQLLANVESSTST
jgi:hypothetical protein